MCDPVERSYHIELAVFVHNVISSSITHAPRSRKQNHSACCSLGLDSGNSRLATHRVRRVMRVSELF